MASIKEDAKTEIQKIAAENDGKIFMGLVNHFYGPLRGLNFLISNPDPEELMKIMDSQQEYTEEEYAKLITFAQTDTPPKNLKELIFGIWKKIGLSSQLMILPNNMIEEAENPPSVVSTIKEGVQEIFKNFKTNEMIRPDLFFYRLGTH